jgi:hypothetical protein
MSVAAASLRSGDKARRLTEELLAAQARVRTSPVKRRAGDTRRKSARQRRRLRQRAPIPHDQKSGSLGCIFKDVIFSMKPTNERPAGLETALPCSPVATAHPQDATSEIPSSGPAAINIMTPDVQHLFVTRRKDSLTSLAWCV